MNICDYNDNSMNFYTRLNLSTAKGTVTNSGAVLKASLETKSIAN